VDAREARDLGGRVEGALEEAAARALRRELRAEERQEREDEEGRPERGEERAAVPPRDREVHEEDDDRLEMSLVSLRPQRIAIEDLELTVEFGEGEPIVTEHAYKYSRRELEVLAHAASFDVVRQWFDESQRFSLNLLTPRGR
jgi:hypothetical protein